MGTETGPRAAEILDVAIVGGGAAGIYSGWRLLTAADLDVRTVRQAMGAPATSAAGGRLNVALFEGSGRIGGRLLSVTPPGMPHIKCELGGMRYMSAHTLVRSLVEDVFDLPRRPFNVAEPNNIAYLRGKRLRLRDYADPDKVPYNLAPDERIDPATGKGRDPSSLVSYAADKLIPADPPLSQRGGKAMWDVLKTAKIDGHHIYEYGYWNLIAKGMSHEAFQYATICTGYDCLSLDWNAADTLAAWCDFTPGATYSIVTSGYDDVPRKLCQRFTDAGGDVHLNHRLKSFDVAQLPDGTDHPGVRLIVERTAAGGPNETVTVWARALILAMPRRSLELLDQTGVVMRDPEFRHLLGTVTPVPLFKLFTCYEEPWWRAVGVTEGRSLTDLPLRQLYYWAVEGEQPGADPNNTNAVLLATYDDTLNIDFWSGYRTWPMHYVLGGRGGRPLPWRGEPGAPYEQRATPFGQVHAGSEGWREHKAPAAMVREAHRQVKEMHGVPDAPEPYAAAYRDWGDDPFGGGVHFWTAHNKSWEIVPRMVKPLSAFPVYVCGEAYSGTQTWVEGALETAELVLQKHLHLPAPAWAKPAAPSGSSGTPPAATPATATPTAAPAAGAGSAARR